MLNATVGRQSLVESAIFAGLGLGSVAEGIHLYMTKDAHLLYAMLKPGFYIVVLGLVLIALGASHYLVALKHPRERGVKPPFDRGSRTRLFGIVGALIFYSYLISITGYVISSLAFFMLTLKILGVRIWPTALVVSVALTAINYVVFVRLCDVIWPETLIPGVW